MVPANEGIWNCGPMEKPPVNFDPNAIAIQYYFGDLQYWKLPGICIEALEHGFDGW